MSRPASDADSGVVLGIEIDHLVGLTTILSPPVSLRTPKSESFPLSCSSKIAATSPACRA